jgi:hypothetical protein
VWRSKLLTSEFFATVRWPTLMFSMAWVLMADG